MALLVFVAFGPFDWAKRYSSWNNLSKAELVASANRYVENRAPGNAACLYAVECIDGRARLKLVKSMDDWSIDGPKQIAWDRKFSGMCEGRTANFALELASDRLVGAGNYDGTRRAVWSFYNDGFVPVRGRFDHSAFSEEAPEPCVSRYVVTGAAQPGV
ncbi:hypothetical protein [Sphingopyxis sp. KK2]|uniref:hypothetical protein n=1 Tax=Sphingopyxis sp. KK2 TaxID=1855727 RepID=UPI0011818F69|nr:hypothetical protein [Sphingopyxis sp. KK2]